MQTSLFPEQRIRLKNGKYGTKPQKMLEKASAMHYDYNRMLSINKGLVAQNRQLQTQIDALRTALNNTKKSTK